MFPVLIKLPFVGFEIPTYGVLLAAAFLLILKVAAVLARRDNIEVRHVLDLALVVFLSGLVGAKLLLVLLDLNYYIANPAALKDLLRAAGVFYGGLLLAVPVGVIFAWRRGLPLWKVADIAGVCVPVGLAMGRLGCLAAGCCHGGACSLPWAITYTSEVAARTTGVPLNIPLHPTPIYLSINGMVLAAILYWRWKHRAYTGQVFLWFIILYGLTRSFWELFRGDGVRGFLIPGVLSTSQAVGLASALVGLIALFIRARRAGSVS